MTENIFMSSESVWKAYLNFRISICFHCMATHFYVLALPGTSPLLKKNVFDREECAFWYILNELFEGECFIIFGVFPSTFRLHFYWKNSNEKRSKTAKSLQPSSMSPKLPENLSLSPEYLSGSSQSFNEKKKPCKRERKMWNRKSHFKTENVQDWVLVMVSKKSGIY